MTKNTEVSLMNLTLMNLFSEIFSRIRYTCLIESRNQRFF